MLFCCLRSSANLQYPFTSGCILLFFGGFPLIYCIELPQLSCYIGALVMQANWNNSYAALPAQMFTRQAPVPVAAPKALMLNAEHAEELGITFGEDWPLFMAGNQIPLGAEPIAQAYAGHQFGHWNPQLGDRRAVLLGEVIGRCGISVMPTAISKPISNMQTAHQ